MRRWIDIILAAAVAGTLAYGGESRPAHARPAAAPDGPAAAGAGGAAAAKPIQEIRLTLDRYPDGKPKTLLTARAAQVPMTGQEGDIVAEGVVVFMYDEQGGEEGRLEMADCRYNREKGTASTASPVRVRSRGMTLTGTGMEWCAADEQVRILADVRVEFARRDLETLRKTR